MLNSRLIQLKALRWGGREVWLRASGERASRSFAVVQGGKMLGVGCRDELCSSVSVQNSALHCHSCPLQAAVLLLCDLGQVPAHPVQVGVEPLTPSISCLF